jgi:DNA-directed RNA polymerase
MPGSVFKDILSDFKDNILMLDLPLKLPMIVKPKEYKREIKDDKTNEILGGYLLNDTKITTPLIIENPELKCNSEIRKENKIYNMVNSISSVSYKINTDVLEFIILYSEKFNLFPEPKNLDVILNKIKRTTLEKKELESFLSLRRLEMNILSIAQIYSLVSEFYFPVRIDSRGRLYCYSDYLNYQSIELAKALLNFAEGNKINSYDKNALNFIKIYGANNYGNKLDKLSFQKRIE